MQFELSSPLLPLFLVDKIIEKYDYPTGLKLYRSCKEIERYFDEKSPGFFYNNSDVSYSESFKWTIVKEFVALVHLNCIPFLRTKSFSVESLPTEVEFYSNLGKMGPIEELRINTSNFSSLSAGPKILQNIMSIVRPRKLFFTEGNVNVLDPILKKIPHITIFQGIHRSKADPHWTIRYYTSLQNITLQFYFIGPTVLTSCLTEWENGIETKSLKSFVIVNKDKKPDGLKKALEMYFPSEKRLGESTKITVTRTAGQKKTAVLSYSTYESKYFKVEIVTFLFLD